MTTGEYDAVEGFRDRGGSLVMLSADNFFWRIDLQNGVMTRIAKWRELGRPEAALLGVQYIGNDMGEHRGAWHLRKAPATGWLFAGTGSDGRARPSRTQVSRSTTPPPARPAARRCLASSRPSRPRHDRSDDLLLDIARSAGLLGGRLLARGID